MGFETSDDAGVYRLNDEQAIVSTADFITPPVDDPYLFGQIAAANALSDVYAMGGRPLTCLSLVGFPSARLGPDILRGIITGAMSKITEAGAVLVGGHTTEDEEPKFGLAVTGIVHPGKIWRNSGAQPGDLLILTKPLGSGVLFNANLKKWVSDAAMQACIRVLTTLNRTAAEVLSRYDVHGVTDVTGFGLAGHGLEMARGSGVTLEIRLSDVPLMREATAVYARGMSTGMNRSNRRMVEKDTSFSPDLSPEYREIAVDPQTSGGLLVSVREDQAPALLAELHRSGVSDARIIGRVLARQEKFLIFS
ncbi:selenide, water dikinase [Desulfonema ishimotonii]|uniref:Selenide, water dikinase n=1 Tax=Desulfonema ishimotonii TaxID=45657 RepID=A0A401FY46_9BACT|nr:selenide, water dikinase [Desulfonema ishimotonii]